MLGQLLDARYRLINVLGEGGFSQTYVAEDTRLPGNPKCVVKHLKPALSDPKFLENARRLFEREAETLQKLGHHDQIPRLLAHFEENQEFYLVQELIEGHLLSEELVPGSRRTESEVVKLLQEVLRILDFVHSSQVIHRDIKPNNIIRRQQDNKLVLVDFGTVKQIKVQQATAQSQMSKSIVIGTVGYMPTEQARGKPRPSSDIYALGIIGIQALTGLNPQELPEDSNGEIIWQSGAQVSDRLAAVLTKMVRYHFKDRYESATEVLDALQSLATHPGYAPTELDPRPRYTQTQPAIQGDAAPAPVSTQDIESESGQQVNPGTSDNSSGQPTASGSHTNPSSPNTGSQISSYSKFITFIKSPFGVTLGIAALIGVLAAFALSWNNKQGLEATLENARKLAVDGKSVEAVAEAVKIPSSNPSYIQAQQLIDQSSVNILKRATEIYEESNDLDKAIELARKIPERSTAAFQEAQVKIYGWQKESRTNKDYLNAAQRELDEDRWQNAINEANKISRTPFWKKQKDQIVQSAKSKLEAAKPKLLNTQPSQTSSQTSIGSSNPSPASSTGQSKPTLEPNQFPTTIDNCTVPESIFGQSAKCDESDTP